MNHLDANIRGFKNLVSFILQKILSETLSLSTFLAREVYIATKTPEHKESQRFS